jgi:class 3 adenylate cyclase
VMDDGQTLDIGPDTAFDIPPGHDKWVVGDEPWVTIEWRGSGRAFGEAIADAGSRMLASVVFTDIVDSTQTLQELGDAAWRDVLSAHNGRLREVLNAYRGREIKTTGDGLLAVFDSPPGSSGVPRR